MVAAHAAIVPAMPDHPDPKFSEVHTDTTPDGHMAPAVCAQTGHVWRCERCGVSPESAEHI